MTRVYISDHGDESGNERDGRLLVGKSTRFQGAGRAVAMTGPSSSWPIVVR